MEGTVFQSTGDLATDWAAVWASLVRGDDSPELLEAALAVIRSGLSSDRLSDLAALAGRSASPAHRFLLVEGLHGSKDLEQAETELRSGWRDRKQRGALRELALRFLPRAQERFRFYDCHRMVGFRGRHVLEIGGQLPAFFVEAAEPASWTAVDLQPDDDVADRVFYRVVEGDAADLPLPDESFSVVFSSSAFEHIANLGEALYEMHRVLKPNGVVYSDFSPIWSSEEGHHLRGAARRALRDHGLWPLPPWAHLTSSRKEMRRHLAQKLDGKQIRTVERWLYRRKSLNRLFYEDYVHLFHSSPLEVVRLDRRRGKSPDAKTLKRLERRQSERSLF